MNIGTIGTVYVDIKGYPQDEFSPNGRNAGEVKQFHGGVGRNIAEDVAALGEKSIFIGLVDDTGIGIDVVNHLKSKGLVTDYIQPTPDGMGTWIAIFDESGEVYANISKRPNLLPICQILDEDGDKLFSQLDSILVEMDIDEEIVAKAFSLAEKHNIPVYGVISNMTIAKERLSYIQKLSCFICNKQESGILFDEAVDTMTPSEVLELLKKKQIELKIQSMVITMDSDGAVFSQINGKSGQCPAQQVTVVDTTGAGDSFFASTCVGLTRGNSLLEACQLGIKVASKVITTKDNVYIK